MKLSAAAALLAAVGISVQGVWAAELGTLSVSSRLNEPLSAKLTVNDVTEASQPLVLRLASDAVYAKVGQKPIPASLGVKLTLAGKNPWVVNVTSAQPVTVEDMPIIVEMSEAGKLSAKFYRVKLEKAPTVAQTTAKAPLTKLPSAQPVKTAALPSAEKTTSSVKRTAEPVAVAKAPVKTAVVTKTAAPKAALADNLYGLTDLSRPVTVKSGMTMWSIAKMYQPRYEGARTEEVLVALVRANPKAFEGGRVTGVRNGARLVPPSEKLVKSVGTDTAWCLVHVTPNADARKVPSAAAMAKAHARMDKQGIAYTKTKPAVKATPVVKEQEPVKGPEAVGTPAVLPAVEPVPPEAKPVTLPMPVEAQRPVVTEEAKAEALAAPVVTPEAPAPMPAAEEKPKEADLTVTTTTTNIRTEELPQPAEEGGWGWLWALLAVIVAGAGGFFFWRRKKEKEAFEKTAQAVRFMRPEPTSAEQVKGMDTLFANRVAADAAAAKGFEAKPTVQRVEPRVAVPPTVAAAPAMPETPAAEVPPATPAAPVPTPVALAEPEEPKAFTIRSTSDGTSQFEVAATDEALKKLEAARAKIAAGLPDEAIPLLKEAELLGTPEEKVTAQRLLDTVKRV